MMMIELRFLITHKRDALGLYEYTVQIYIQRFLPWLIIYKGIQLQTYN